MPLFLKFCEGPQLEMCFFELLEFTMPIWAVVVVGVLVGWAWRPKWADNTNSDFLDYTSNKVMSKKSVYTFLQLSALIPSLSLSKLQLPAWSLSWISDYGLKKDNSPSPSISDISSSEEENEKSSLVNDLRHLSYQAWRKDLETGRPRYRSQLCTKIPHLKW